MRRGVKVDRHASIGVGEKASALVTVKHDLSGIARGNDALRYKLCLGLKESPPRHLAYFEIKLQGLVRSMDQGRNDHQVTVPHYKFLLMQFQIILNFNNSNFEDMILEMKFKKLFLIKEISNMWMKFDAQSDILLPDSKVTFVTLALALSLMKENSSLFFRLPNAVLKAHKKLKCG